MPPLRCCLLRELPIDDAVDAITALFLLLRRLMLIRHDAADSAMICYVATLYADAAVIFALTARHYAARCRCLRLILMLLITMLHAARCY